MDKDLIERAIESAEARIYKLFQSKDRNHTASHQIKAGNQIELQRVTVEVLKKQLPMEPHKYIAFDGIERNGCPRCFGERGRNEILYAGQKYCSVCGQKILWRTVRESRN